MSVKSVALTVLPRPAQTWVKDGIYRRHCKLEPSQYRSALKKWYWMLKGRSCNLDDPQTLSDKINWLKLYDSTPLKGRLADKYLVREWVAQRVGEQHLAPLYGVWDSPDEINFDELPERFILKATHSSGMYLIVRDKAQLDVEAARRQMRGWLSRRHAMRGGFELHYEYCEPRIICEKLMEDDSGGLRDYKFMTFGGDVQFAFTVDRHTGVPIRGTYLPDWTRAPFEYVCESTVGPDVDAPECLDKMVDIARILGEDFACVRVDLYEVDGEVYFGELTFTCSDGLFDFVPARYDLEFGRRLELPEKKPFEGVML